MSRSDAYEKAAFDWAATTDVNNITWEHILKAYRLNLKSCSSKPNACKYVNQISGTSLIWLAFQLNLIFVLGAIVSTIQSV